MRTFKKRLLILLHNNKITTGWRQILSERKTPHLILALILFISSMTFENAVLGQA